MADDTSAPSSVRAFKQNASDILAIRLMLTVLIGRIAEDKGDVEAVRSYLADLEDQMNVLYRQIFKQDSSHDPVVADRMKATISDTFRAIKISGADK